MTYQVNNIERRLNIALRWLGIAFGVVVVFGVVSYDRATSVRREFNDIREYVQTLQADNAELKNELYQLVDTKSLNAVAMARGLVKEQNPQYLNVRSGVLLAGGY